MKRMILSAILFLGLTTFAAAQSSGSTGSGSGGGASKTKGKKPSEKLDNRKIYHFKNGQRSTPTGAEATGSGTGGGFAALGKDTTPTVAAPAKTNAVTKKTTAKRGRKTSNK
jgi:hypothetical protein